MKSLILACCLFLAQLAHAATDPVLVQQVNAFVDGWHDDAAHARMRYFDKMAPDGVYIGTDRSELWQRDAFREWGRKYFEGRQAAWVFHPTRRNVYATPDGTLIWFDELLDTENMGHCMASGVIRRTAAGFEIVHYQLSLAVPNDVAKQVLGIVTAAEARVAAGPAPAPAPGQASVPAQTPTVAPVPATASAAAPARAAASAATPAVAPAPAAAAMPTAAPAPVPASAAAPVPAAIFRPAATPAAAPAPAPAPVAAPGAAPVETSAPAPSPPSAPAAAPASAPAATPAAAPVPAPAPAPARAPAAPSAPTPAPAPESTPS